MKSRMIQEVQQNLSQYLDSANVFNCTALAEHFIAIDEPEDEDEYFDTAVEVANWATKTYNLNE